MPKQAKPASRGRGNGPAASGAAPRGAAALTEGLDPFDRERASSLADEGGAAAAAVEARPRHDAGGAAEEEGAMLFEVSVIPLGGDVHTSDELGDVLSVIDRSGLPYQLGPGSTCIEGGWDEAITLVRDCHREARRRSKHVITLVKIEDDEGQSGKLQSNVTSVEEKAGRPLVTCAATAPSQESPRSDAPAARRRRPADGTSARSRRARA